MTRHIIDRAETKAEGARVRHFVDLLRKEGVHPAILELGQRPVRARSASKVREFLRIERMEKSAS